MLRLEGVEGLRPKKLECLTPVPMRLALDIPKTYIVITLYLQQGRKKESMKMHIVRIGNSRWMRLPKPVTEQRQFYPALGR
jgi:hypothetical protein